MMQTEHFHAALAVEFYGSVGYAALPRYSPLQRSGNFTAPRFCGRFFLGLMRPAPEVRPTTHSSDRLAEETQERFQGEVT